MERLLFVKIEKIRVHEPPKGHAFFRETGVEDPHLSPQAQLSSYASSEELSARAKKGGRLRAIPQYQTQSGEARRKGTTLKGRDSPHVRPQRILL